MVSLIFYTCTYLIIGEYTETKVWYNNFMYWAWYTDGHGSTITCKGINQKSPPSGFMMIK